LITNLRTVDDFGRMRQCLAIHVRSYIQGCIRVHLQTYEKLTDASAASADTHIRTSRVIHYPLHM